jgi:uncharacterized protein (DUF169 family)
LIHETGVKATVAHRPQELFPRVTGLSFETLDRLTEINDAVVEAMPPKTAARYMAATLRELLA